MVVLIVESAPPGLRGELSKWMLEPKAGVFVGRISGAVRDLIWDKACQEVGSGGCTMIFNASNEQGFSIRTWGDTSRLAEDWVGLLLIRRPAPIVEVQETPEFIPPEDWNEYLYPEIWAKTLRGVQLKESEPSYHPLACHMIDTAMVALFIWRFSMPLMVKEDMRKQLGVATIEEAGLWFAYFAGLHDLGKATPLFERQWSKGWSVLIQKGFANVSSAIKVPHYAFSAEILGELLTKTGLPDSIADPVAVIAGSHHGLLPGTGELKVARQYSGSGKWPEARIHLVRLLGHILGIDRLAIPTQGLYKANGLLALLAGLTSISDWIASNHDYFTFAGDEVSVPQYVHKARRHSVKALRRLGWFNRPREVPALSFVDLFDKEPNNLQRQVIEVSEKLSGPSLILLEYPMGGGKTEAALYLADRLANSAGQKGIYFALPTMATSNQMFKRVNNYLKTRFPNMTINTQLLHGHASLNSEFKLLMEAEEKLFEPSEIQEEKNGGLMASEWFTYKKRGLLAPYGIGTIDQALMAVLQSKHFFVRLFGLAGKVVIFDEVHAYDTYMQTLLLQLLSWLALCGTSVILLSATLPKQTRQRLLSAYAAGRGQGDISLLDSGYPRISWITSGESNAVSISEVPNRVVDIKKLSQAEEVWASELQSALAQGGCAAVIVNTVTRAQEVYESLKGYFQLEELILFHARFPFDDRMVREQIVLDKFGPDSTDRPYRAVVVATQVIEQSLDLDFDLMVTDLAPVDLILQRSGRLWRHVRSKRPVNFTRPTIWILMPQIDNDGKPAFRTGDIKVYDLHTLLRSWLVLSDKESLDIPDKVEEMVEAVYNPAPPDPVLPVPIQMMWNKSLAELNASFMKDESEAARRHICPVDEEMFSMTMEALSEDEEAHPAVQALTRLGGPSVTVVCLLEESGKLWATGASRREIHLEKCLDNDDVRVLLGRSVSISFDPSLVKEILKQEPPPTWEKSAYLRRCRLLRFNSDGICLNEGIPLVLDVERGLMELPKV